MGCCLGSVISLGCRLTGIIPLGCMLTGIHPTEMSSHWDHPIGIYCHPTGMYLTGIHLTGVTPVWSTWALCFCACPVRGSPTTSVAMGHGAVHACQVYEGLVGCHCLPPACFLTAHGETAPLSHTIAHSPLLLSCCNRSSQKPLSLSWKWHRTLCWFNNKKDRYRLFWYIVVYLVLWTICLWHLVCDNLWHSGFVMFWFVINF